MDIVNLLIKVGTQEVDKAQKSVGDLHRTLQSAESAGFKFGSALGTAMKAVVGGAAAAGAALGTISVALINQIDDLQDLAEMYGYSATQIAAFKTAAADAGGSLEDITKASSKANRELSEGGKAFKNLGISVRAASGELKSGRELASEVAQAYLDGKTTAAQFADVQAVLGKDVDRTAQVLKAAGDAQQMVNELQAQGIGIYEEATNATNAYNAEFNRLTLVAQSAGSVIVAKVAPAFTELIKKFTDSYVNGGLVRQIFDSLVNDVLPGFVTGLAVGATAVAYFVNGLAAIWYTAEAAGRALYAVATGDWDSLKTIGTDYVTKLTAASDKTNQFVDGIWKAQSEFKKMVRETSDKPLTIAASKNGKTNNGPTPVEKPKGKFGGDDQAMSALDAQEKALVKLQQEYLKLFGIETRVNEFEARSTVEQIRRKEDQARAEGKVVNAMSEVQAKQIIQAGIDRDFLERLNRITAAQQKSKEVIEAARQSSALEVEENRKRVNLLGQYGKTQDDVNVAIAEYRVQMADAALKTFELSTANRTLTEAEELKLVKLREEVALLREKAGVARSTAEDNKQTLDSSYGKPKTLDEGMQEGLKRIRQQTMTTGEMMANAMEDAAGRMGDAFAEFTTTGKLNMRSFAASFLADIAKMIAKQLIFRAIGGFFGGGGGLIPGGVGAVPYAKGGAFSGGVQFFANGGVVSSPTAFGMAGGLGVMGEAGPEAIMPLKRGSDGKLGVQVSGAGSNTVQNISVNVTVQGGDTSAETAQATARAVENAARKVFAEEQAKLSRRKAYSV